MNLLQSICCLFGGRCGVEEPKPTKETGDTAGSEADLGQEEADLEKTGKERMSHLEGGGTTRQKPRKPR
jgi:hypothetical protein